MEHHRVEAELLELIELPIERLRRPRRGAVRVLPFAEVPGTETELVFLFCHSCQGTVAGWVGMEREKFCATKGRQMSKRPPVAFNDVLTGMGATDNLTAWENPQNNDRNYEAFSPCVE